MTPLGEIYAVIGSVMLVATGPVAQAPLPQEGEPNVVEESVEEGDIAIETLPDDLSTLGPVSYDPDFAVQGVIAFELWRQAGSMLAMEAGEEIGPDGLDAFAATRIAGGADATRAAETLAALSQLAGAGGKDERAQLLACLSHDTDPEVGLDLAVWNGDTVAVFDACGNMDRDILTEAWDVRLAPLARFEDEPRMTVPVVYRGAADLADARRAIEESAAMDTVAEALAEGFVVAGPAEIVALSCGAGSAPTEPGRIAICYEAVEAVQALLAAPE